MHLMENFVRDNSCTLRLTSSNAFMSFRVNLRCNPLSLKFQNLMIHQAGGRLTTCRPVGQFGIEFDTAANCVKLKEIGHKEPEYAAPERDSICFKASPETRGQLSVTLKWLLDTYEYAEGICLPRCELYAHYQDFCQRREFKAISPASFGKLIRQQFPKLKTRRLGTRGQSKYHYYGIGIKETSIYYQSVYSGCGLTRFSGTKVKTEGTCRKYSLSSKIGTLLPDFPDAESLILSDELRHEEVNTFLLMYQLHCQRILDMVIAASFDEVLGFITVLVVCSPISAVTSQPVMTGTNFFRRQAADLNRVLLQDPSSCFRAQKIM
ncbi:DNA-binding protein RFX6-like [Scyliorhinus canicula]|uniref:DNA-binding protein RFX6-like n=1 Tax=Scyliorhinus canicula TaxID=7830 RepID=UPI0018F3B81A|nr:DNA-binding protein RFX6-like [Scyliorhinus canicula]